MYIVTRGKPQALQQGKQTPNNTRYSGTAHITTQASKSVGTAHATTTQVLEKIESGSLQLS